MAVLKNNSAPFCFILQKIFRKSIKFASGNLRIAACATYNKKERFANLPNENVGTSLKDAEVTKQYLL